MSLPKEGQIAPDFTLPDQDGIKHTLSQYNNTWVALYFYPKDDTPGCTTQACGLRDNIDTLKSYGVTVLGVSTDSIQSHQKFANKYNLPFTLLADAQKQVVEQYGVWQEKKFMGKKFMGIARTTFLIGPDQKIVKIYPEVDPERHAQNLINDLEALKKK